MTVDVDSITLSKGKHDFPADGVCIMEAVAMLAGEAHTDCPVCASPVIATFLRSWNDDLDDVTRQDLRQYILRLVGSAGTVEQESRRSWMALDWLVRVQTVAWLRLAGLTAEADRLVSLGEVDAVSCPAIIGPLKAIRGAANQTATAATTDTTAHGAAYTALAAHRAAYTACAELGAARAATWDATWDAARAAARFAAGDAFQRTVGELQASAHDLIDRMLAVTETPAS